MCAAETWALKEAPEKGAPNNLGNHSNTYQVFNISMARRMLSVCFATTTLDRMEHIIMLRVPIVLSDSLYNFIIKFSLKNNRNKHRRKMQPCMSLN